MTRLISPIASTNFATTVGKLKGDEGDILDNEQLEAIRSQIATAEERNIGARYWGTPGWPVRTRNLIWRILLEEEVALLNADDLAAPGENF